MEGASGGKGLGHKFLRHVRRTKILVHLVSLENDNPVEAYETVRRELARYDPVLSEKKEIILLTKTDTITDPASIKRVVEEMKKKTESVYTVSIYDDEAIKALQSTLLEEVREVSMHA